MKRHLISLLLIAIAVVPAVGRADLQGDSLEATDVAVVHAGYAKRRKALLAAGITLYELPRLSPRPDTDRRSAIGSVGSSGSSLHAKTFSADGTSIYIGSFNFDPRSAMLNTELGFVIESHALVRRIQAAFNNSIPARSYRVDLSDGGQLYWTEHSQGKLVRDDTEPGTSFWQRAGVWFLSLWPIEWML